MMQKPLRLKYIFLCIDEVQIVLSTVRPSDRVRKKTENYAEIVDNIMRKKVTIMQKRHQIMRKFVQLNKVAPMAFSDV